MDEYRKRKYSAGSSSSEDEHKEAKRIATVKKEIDVAINRFLHQNDDSVDESATPSEIRIMNELIREYFDWNGLYLSDDAFCTELGKSGPRMSRDELTHKLGVTDDEVTIKKPIIIFLLQCLKGDENKLLQV